MAFFRKKEKEEVQEQLEQAPQMPQEVTPPAPPSRLDELRAELEQMHLPEYARTVAFKELERLGHTEPSSAEYSIGLNYLEFIASLPWFVATEDNLDMERAEQILSQDHAGMVQVKERVLEHLAVSIRVGSQPLRVLVVDDEPIALENMAIILSREGYETHTASGGPQALAMLAEEEFDLVVSDLKMDRLDGMQLLEKAKHISPNTRFIIITGYATVATAVDAMRKGAVHFLAKPIDLNVLRQVAADALSGVRRRRLAPGTVLCFSGPPGTGKTSVGQSIAHALGRSFARLSMAGMRDESEMRGHRRTYVGAMPGRILSELRRAGVNNPVFMLDELDKIGQDFRGDPASILLEVLDPAQNTGFLDYYLDMPFDLSGVLFLATANMVERLSKPLLDRLEIIEFSAYTPSEKRIIVQNHLLPRQLERHGLLADEMTLTPDAIDLLVSGYTREAGVRNLDREIGGLCRKVNRQLISCEQESCVVDTDMVEELLGPIRITREAARGADVVGMATAMVWTEYGGEILFVETACMPGRGKLLMTGSLGDVLKESAQTALSYVRSQSDRLGIEGDFFATKDIHVHIPAGSVPKDGPSAGITIATALISLLTDRPARRNVAMTGELSLSGRVLPVSGLRMKILAAAQAGVVKVVLPERNRPDVEALEPEVQNALEIVFASRADDVLEHVLLPEEAAPAPVPTQPSIP
ncbi:S16 family serine protease [Desulfovibrio inopinatus]|uniref:S16 family serine protease n=1 Tax=Desulfovibrio inopinatus TaxID=102109 RepID=UPI00042A8FFF|nr:S16 family serine protease [Desulfovibrio inopinatus]